MHLLNETIIYLNPNLLYINMYIPYFVRLTLKILSL